MFTMVWDLSKFGLDIFADVLKTEARTSALVERISFLLWWRAMVGIRVMVIFQRLSFS